jgi:hypothetical protein
MKSRAVLHTALQDTSHHSLFPRDADYKRRLLPSQHSGCPPIGTGGQPPCRRSNVSCSPPTCSPGLFATESEYGRIRAQGLALVMIGLAALGMLLGQWGR